LTGFYGYAILFGLSILVSTWKWVLARITEMLPDGINWTINNIDIPSGPIQNPAAPAMPSAPDTGGTWWDELVDWVDSWW
jgi:hypothetical protein